jgi:hypothetical protein
MKRIGRGMAHERSPAIVALADGGNVEVGSHDQLMAARAAATTAA